MNLVNNRPELLVEHLKLILSLCAVIWEVTAWYLGLSGSETGNFCLQSLRGTMRLGIVIKIYLSLWSLQSMKAIVIQLLNKRTSLISTTNTPVSVEFYALLKRWWVLHRIGQGNFWGCGGWRIRELSVPLLLSADSQTKWTGSRKKPHISQVFLHSWICQLSQHHM